MPSVPVEVGAVLGTMLRVAVDDVVGAERVRLCELAVSCADGRAVLEISDDRPDPQAVPLPCDLREAVEAVGATVTRSVGLGLPAGRAPVAPLPRRGSAPGGIDDRHRRSRSGAHEAAKPVAAAAVRPDDAHRCAGRIRDQRCVVVLLSDLTPTSAAHGTGTVASVMVLLLAVISRRGSRAVHRLAAFAAQAALSVCSIALLADPYVGLPGFVAGSALLVLPRGVRWPAFAAVALAVTAAQAVLIGAPVGIAYGLFATVNHGLVAYGLTRLRDLVESRVGCPTSLSRSRANVPASRANCSATGLGDSSRASWLPSRTRPVRSPR